MHLLLVGLEDRALYRLIFLYIRLLMSIDLDLKNQLILGMQRLWLFSTEGKIVCR